MGQACTTYGPRAIWPANPNITSIWLHFWWKHYKNLKTRNQSGCFSNIFLARHEIWVVHPWFMQMYLYIKYAAHTQPAVRTHIQNWLWILIDILLVSSKPTNNLLIFNSLAFWQRKSVVFYLIWDHYYLMWPVEKSSIESAAHGPFFCILSGPPINLSWDPWGHVYKQLLHKQIPQAQKNSHVISILLCFWVASAQKLLVKHWWNWPL